MGIKLDLPKFKASTSFNEPRITIGRPKITLSDKDRSAIAGYVAFGSAGAYAGHHYGDKLGNWFQSRWEDVTGKTTRIAQEEAMKEQERLRREAIVKEYGMKQQADASVLAGLTNRGNNSGKFVGVTSKTEGMPTGAIGTNIGSSTSGTF